MSLTFYTLLLARRYAALCPAFHEHKCVYTNSNGVVVLFLCTVPVLSSSTFWSLSSLLLANHLISMSTVYVFRSQWRSLFLMYEGGHMNDVPYFCILNSWNYIGIAIFGTTPQWHSLVHTGLTICLYRRSLLCRDSMEFLEVSKYIFLHLILSSLSFFYMFFPS